MSDYSAVPGLGVSVEGAVLRLHLDRPDKRNAIDDTMTEAMADALDVANRDEAVRAVLLTAAGPHFCSGADIVARNSGGSGQRPRVGSIQRRLPSLAHRLVAKVMEVQLPVVCATRGHVAGIGLHLALASDFVLVAPDARFWEPFSSRGFTPDSAGTWLLPRRFGPVVARRMLLLGEPMAGAELASAGLVHAAIDDAGLDGEALALAQRLAAGPTVSLGLTKWLLLAGSTATLPEHLQNEALAMELSSRSEDFREGLKAFTERRSPDFGGR